MNSPQHLVFFIYPLAPPPTYVTLQNIVSKFSFSPKYSKKGPMHA